MSWNQRFPQTNTTSQNLELTQTPSPFNQMGIWVWSGQFGNKLCEHLQIDSGQSPFIFLIWNGKVLKRQRMQNKNGEHISILFSINQQKKLTRKYLGRMHLVGPAIETEIGQINLTRFTLLYGRASVSHRTISTCVEQHLGVVKRKGT